MQMNNITRVHKNKKSPAVGRGGKRGKTSGKGTKGQNARAGRKKRPEMRDIIKKLPKLRGRGKNSNKTIQTKVIGVNLSSLNLFSTGEIVSPRTLVEKGILKKVSGNYPRVKILGSEDFDKKITVRSCATSVSAREKILSLGGSVSGVELTK